MTIEELSRDIVEQSSYIGNSVQDFHQDSFEKEGADFEESRRSKIICILEESLIFLDGATIYDLLEIEAQKIFASYPAENFEDFWIKFLFHTSNMLERAIRKDQFLREDAKEIIQKNPELFTFLKALFTPIENRYAIEIEESELSYLMELIEVNLCLAY